MIFGYDYSKYFYPRWHQLCSVDKEEGITDHRTGTTYSWEEISGPASELYDRITKRNEIEIKRERLFKYGFILEEGTKCIFELGDIPNRDIFLNVIFIYKGMEIAPDWSKNQAMLEKEIINDSFLRYRTIYG